MAALDVSFSRGVQQALSLEMVWELAWCLPFDRFLTDKTILGPLCVRAGAVSRKVYSRLSKRFRVGK